MVTTSLDNNDDKVFLQEEEKEDDADMLPSSKLDNSKRIFEEFSNFCKRERFKYIYKDTYKPETKQISESESKKKLQTKLNSNNDIISANDIEISGEYNQSAKKIFSQQNLLFFGKPNDITEINFTHANRIFTLTPDNFNQFKSELHDAKGGFGEVRFVTLKPDQSKNLEPVTENDSFKFAMKSTNLAGNLKDQDNSKTIAGANMTECRILKHLKKHSIGVFVDFIEYKDQAWTILEYCEYSLTKIYKKFESLGEMNLIPTEILLQSIFTTIDTIATVSKYGEIPSFAHGDIKPDNLMFKIHRRTQKVICHLIDFGTCGPDDTVDEPPKDYGVTKPYLPGDYLCSL